MLETERGQEATREDFTQQVTSEQSSEGCRSISSWKQELGERVFCAEGTAFTEAGNSMRR